MGARVNPIVWRCLVTRKWNDPRTRFFAFCSIGHKWLFSWPFSRWTWESRKSRLQPSFYPRKSWWSFSNIQSFFSRIWTYFSWNVSDLSYLLTNQSKLLSSSWQSCESKVLANESFVFSNESIVLTN
jgi:hypothetical protein